MDGKGVRKRTLDNIFIERLWHAVNGGVKTGHAAAQNQASGEAPSAMARALPK